MCNGVHGLSHGALTPRLCLPLQGHASHQPSHNQAGCVKGRRRSWLIAKSSRSEAGVAGLASSQALSSCTELESGGSRGSRKFSLSLALGP